MSIEDETRKQSNYQRLLAGMELIEQFVRESMSLEEQEIVRQLEHIKITDEEYVYVPPRDNHWGLWFLFALWIAVCIAVSVKMYHEQKPVPQEQCYLMNGVEVCR